MITEKIFKKNKNFVLLSLIILCFGVLFYPFLQVIALSSITAYFSYPLFKKFKKKCKIWISMLFTWLIIFLVFFIPISALGFFSIYQAKNIVTDVQINFISANQDTKKTSNTFLKSIDDFIQNNEETVIAIEEEIWAKLSEFGKKMIIKTGDILKQFPFFMLKCILYFFITTSLILHWEKVKNTLRSLAPIENKVFDLYIEKIKYMTDGIMKGNFIVAAIQASITALSFFLVWLPYIGIIFIISFVLYIPMFGTLILYVPASIYLIIKGKYLAAIFLFLINSVLVANIDNVARGRFVPKEAQIDNTLMFISILSGLILFGMMWVLYWPIIAVIGVTSLKLYQELKEKK